MVQLARPQSGLAQPPLTHPLHHHLCTALSLQMSALALIEGLATQPHMAASPRHAQPLDEPLREDLPKGFFTTRTP
jgi:hypothetical protein